MSHKCSSHRYELDHCMKDVLDSFDYLNLYECLTKKEKSFFDRICILSSKDKLLLTTLLNDCLKQKKNDMSSLKK